MRCDDKNMRDMNCLNFMNFLFWGIKLNIIVNYENCIFIFGKSEINKIISFLMACQSLFILLKNHIP